MPVPVKQVAGLLNALRGRIRGAALAGAEDVSGHAITKVRGVAQALRSGKQIKGLEKGAKGLTVKFTDGSSELVSHYAAEARDMAGRMGGRLRSGSRLLARSNEGFGGRIGRYARQGVAGAPLTSLAGAELGASFLAQDVVGPVGEGLYESMTQDPVRGETSAFLGLLGVDREQALRAQRLAGSTEENRARLAKLRPDIYNALVANRPLPRDGVAIGGRRRMDLVDQVAAMMAAGAFPQQELMQ